MGREKELATLKGAFDAACAGQGGLVMVVGEPGIGKTAICEQLGAYVAAAGGRTLAGHCYEEGSLALPYLPFVEALRSYVLDRDAAALRQELGAGAPDVARIVPELRDRLQVEPSPPTTPEEDRFRLFQAVVAFLRNAATEGAQRTPAEEREVPLCLVLEDLHDADKGTLDLLTHLGRDLAAAHLLVVGTYRDVEVDRAHPLSGALAELRRGPAFERIPLRGLTPDEVQRMLTNIAGQATPWPLAEAVHRQTEGNPLFIQEVFRYVAEEGLLVPEQGGWTVRTDILAERIPEGLRDVIGKRLSRLSDPCNRVLAVAAVIGREFALATLEAVAGVSEEELAVALEEAVRTAVLEERAQVGGARYRFTHAFFRQTLYEELIAPRRLRLHQQVARALETQYAGRLDDHAAELAEHFAHSSDPEALAKAVAFGERAAQRATQVYAHGEAARLLDGALAVQEVLDPHDTARRCDLLLALAEALLAAGEQERAGTEVLGEAFALAEALTDRRRALAACELAAGAVPKPDTDPAYRVWVERLDRYADPDTNVRTFADLHLASLNQMAGRLTEGWTFAARGYALAQRLAERGVGDLDQFYFAAAVYADFGLLTGRGAEALAAAEAIAGAPRAGVRAVWHLSTALMLAGNALLAAGDRDRAEPLWQELFELRERTQDAYTTQFGANLRPTIALLDGRLDDVLELTSGLERGDFFGFSQAAPWDRAAALAYLGRHDEALTLPPTLPDDLAGGHEEHYALREGARGRDARPPARAQR